MPDTSFANPVENLNGVVNDGSPKKNLSIESLVFLINAERLKTLNDKTENEFKALKKRQSEVSFLHKLMKAINAGTLDNGSFDCSSNKELQKLLAEAKTMGVDIKDGKFVYSKDERDRLLENIRITVEDLNVQNDMQLQTITRLTNERYESYQMARSIMKPLHDDKINKARAMYGR